MLPSLRAGTLSRAIVITLIHTYFVPIPHYDFLIEHPADNFNDTGVIFILKRPGLDEFMEAAAKLFEMVVFTASSRAYTDPILDWLDVNGTLISPRLFYRECSRFVRLLADGRAETVTVKDLRRNTIVFQPTTRYSFQAIRIN